MFIGKKELFLVATFSFLTLLFASTGLAFTLTAGLDVDFTFSPDNFQFPENVESVAMVNDPAVGIFDSNSVTATGTVASASSPRATAEAQARLDVNPPVPAGLRTISGIDLTGPLSGTDTVEVKSTGELTGLFFADPFSPPPFAVTVTYNLFSLVQGGDDGFINDYEATISFGYQLFNPGDSSPLGGEVILASETLAPSGDNVDMTGETFQFAFENLAPGPYFVRLFAESSVRAAYDAADGPAPPPGDPIPEPGTLLLLGLGCGAVVLARKKLGRQG